MRLVLNLCNYFQDYREVMKIYLNSNIKTIGALECNIAERVGADVSSFYLMCGDVYIPSTEYIGVLNDEDIIMVVPKTTVNLTKERNNISSLAKAANIGATFGSRSSDLLATKENINKESINQKTEKEKVKIGHDGIYFMQDLASKKNAVNIVQLTNETVSQVPSDAIDLQTLLTIANQIPPNPRSVTQPKLSGLTNVEKQIRQSLVDFNTSLTIPVENIPNADDSNSEGKKQKRQIYGRNDMIDFFKHDSASKKNETNNVKLNNVTDLQVCSDATDVQESFKIPKQRVSSPRMLVTQRKSSDPTTTEKKNCQSVIDITTSLTMPVENSQFIEESTTDESCILVRGNSDGRKRKRIRKRKRKVVESTTTAVVESKQEYTPPNVQTGPVSHIRFDEFDTGETGTQEMEHIPETDHENEIPTAELKIANLTPSAYSIIKKPSFNNLILFKKMKLADDYTPQLSNYILGKVLHVSESWITLQIIDGREELKVAQGKLTCFDGDDDSVLTPGLMSCPLNDLHDIRLVRQRLSYCVG